MSADGQAKTAATKAFFSSAGGAAVSGVAKELRGVTTDISSWGALHAPVKNGLLRVSVGDEDVKIAEEGGRTILRGMVHASQPYAYIQHEHAEFKHPKGGEDHYISKRMDAMSDKYQASIAEALASTMRAIA